MSTTEPTGNLTGTATWRNPAWLATALDWAREQVGDFDGPPEQRHVMAWSTAIRLPVRGGAVWLKSVGGGSAHEPVLLAALGQWSPDRALMPIAVDPVRRLVLLPDGGPTLREVGGAASPEGGIPPSVQHDDLHDANVFAADNRYRFFDWGDASVSHPFVSLLIPLRAARVLRGVVPEDRVEWQDSVPGWTAEHLELSSLGAG